eukprot:897268-Rhodomonas_salina.1
MQRGDRLQTSLDHADSKIIRAIRVSVTDLVGGVTALVHKVGHLACVLLVPPLEDPANARPARENA